MGTQYLQYYTIWSVAVGTINVYIKTPHRNQLYRNHQIIQRKRQKNTTQQHSDVKLQSKI